MDAIPDLKNIPIERWDNVAFRDKDLQVDVLRLDRIHPDVSGNKWFKLKYYLRRATLERKQRLVSFGGAYSNHLVALAEACRLYGFSSRGFIRGEKPRQLSHTLQVAIQKGMDLQFLSRQDYLERKKSMPAAADIAVEGDDLIIPEGGAGEEGIQGASEILNLVPRVDSYSHICCAVGTGTTVAGLVSAASQHHQIMGVSVLKGTKELDPLPESWFNHMPRLSSVQMIHEDHFGGYAKSEKMLFDFMNRVFSESGIPTDFVYTGKLFYSVARMAAENGFPAGSRILLIHSGGLQGNQSLPAGLLNF